MTELKSSIGVETGGGNVNWRYLNETRIDDPIISTLVKESEKIYIKNENNSKKINEVINISYYIDTFNIFLKENKYKFSFKVTQEENEKSKSTTQKGKGKEKKLSNKELIIKNNIENGIKKDMKTFIEKLVIINNVPIINKKETESYFSILFWAIYLIHNKKKEIDISYYLDCAISLYRANNESNDILTKDFFDQTNEILYTLEEIIKLKSSDPKYLFKVISNNMLLIIDSLWDKIKPKSIALYQEQKDIISLVTNNLNEKKLIFFEMPPANGKTILSAILAKIINNTNKTNLVTIPKYKRKTLLYICYNTIVRNEVAKLCITHNVDVKYWLAVTKPDKDDGKIKTFLKPYKNCYPDWNKKGLRTKKETEIYEASKWQRFSEDIYVQWKFYLNETRPISEQHKDIKDYENADNLPEMIISDLDSAYTLLQKFPNTFVTYFDEAFASSNLEITSNIMSVLGLTVLVSATLAKPEEIPSVINDYRIRHNFPDNRFLHIVKSTKQHISCTFIDENGYLFAPHNKLDNISQLHEFIICLDKTPLMKRAYSPDIVFSISNVIDDLLPNQLKFKTVFEHIGMINHETLREYMYDIIKFISDTNNEELFNILKSIRINKISDMNVYTIFTNSSIHYQNGKTLHVATNENFNLHVENIAEPFLRNSPRINEIIQSYEKECELINDEIKRLDKSSLIKSAQDKLYEKSRLSRELDEIKLKWPQEFIINSRAHANKFGNLSLLTNPNNEISAKNTDLELLDITRTKLLFSGIGIYQPEDFSSQEMDFFLRQKDSFKFILSTPSIVYGTNISLSIIDIDRSFLIDSTKNTLYQLIGRAGRKGKSHSATVIVRDNRMFDMIIENNTRNIEAEDIERNYQNILHNR